MEYNKPTLREWVIGSFIFLLILGLFIVGMSLAIRSIFLGPISTITPTPIASVSTLPISQYREYESVLGSSPDISFKHFKLNSFSKTNPVSAEIDVDGLSGNLKSTGQFETIYLYAEIFADYTGSLKPGDDFYFKLNESGKLEKEGGHLSPKQSLPIPPDTGAKATQLLYDLREISYWSSIKDLTLKTAYWTSLFNSNKKLIWHSFVSTARPGGTINNISIYYKCSPESLGCSIEKTD